VHEDVREYEDVHAYEDEVRREVYRV